MDHYPIRFTFRTQSMNGHVQDFGEYQLVNFSNSEINMDFTGTLKFIEKKYQPGFIRNKDAKDLHDLVKVVEKQLR
jgi:hypothetical protein